MGEWRKGMDRWVLAVLLGCLALLASAPAALGAEGTGKISGTVTEVSLPHNGIAHIEVTVYETGENEFPVGSAITDEHGEYTVEGLASGDYKVEFSPEFESGLNYVSQYYKDKSSPATAELIKVVQGETKEKIDAELEVGGELEGTVTAACACEDLNPLKGIEVTAYKVGENKFPVGYATTNEKGEYTIAGLASGAYKVKFAPGESGLNYVSQYYNDKSSLAAAEQVIVIQGKATDKIDAELQEGGKIEARVRERSLHHPVLQRSAIPGERRPGEGQPGEHDAGDRRGAGAQGAGQRRGAGRVGVARGGADAVVLERIVDGRTHARVHLRVAAR
jgi:molybdopterin-binding protein